MVKPRFRAGFAGSLFLQALLLVMVSMIIAYAINLYIVFHVAVGPPELYRTTEMAQALQTGRTVAAKHGKPIITYKTRSLDGRGWNDDQLEMYLRNDLSARLGVPKSDVRFRNFLDTRSATRQTVSAIRQFYIENGQLQFIVGSAHFTVGPFTVAVRNQDGTWTVAESERDGLLTPWQTRILIWFAASLVLLTPIAYLFARRLSSPLVAFAEGADRLGRDPTAPPLKLNGPTEMKLAESAFNEMQLRMRRYVEDRTAMIGAVAHDLRTPLTRLRFRVETAPDPVRSKMTADIEQMDEMIKAALSFVRNASPLEARSPLELTSLVQAVADEMAETGLDVEVEPGPSVVILGDSVALRRLVTNLMENAVKFGGRARARAFSDGSAAVIQVEDNGPGVREEDRERVFEPFVRVEPSRNRETGGAGLGLAVVRSVARAHGGDATLENLPEGGLRASVRLPI